MALLYFAITHLQHASFKKKDLNVRLQYWVGCLANAAKIDKNNRIINVILEKRGFKSHCVQPTWTQSPNSYSDYRLNIKSFGRLYAFIQRH